MEARYLAIKLQALCEPSKLWTRPESIRSSGTLIVEGTGMNERCCDDVMACQQDGGERRRPNEPMPNCLMLARRYPVGGCNSCINGGMHNARPF